VPRGQRDGSLRPYSRFSRPEPLLFYQVAPQLYSRGPVDPVPDLLLRKYGSAGNRTRTSGSVARNSDHQTTGAVFHLNYCNTLCTFWIVAFRFQILPQKLCALSPRANYTDPARTLTQSLEICNTLLWPYEQACL
jgi:hypothetical protein